MWRIKFIRGLHPLLWATCRIVDPPPVVSNPLLKTQVLSMMPLSIFDVFLLRKSEAHSKITSLLTCTQEQTSDQAFWDKPSYVYIGTSFCEFNILRQNNIKVILNYVFFNRVGKHTSFASTAAGYFVPLPQGASVRHAKKPLHANH